MERCDVVVVGGGIAGSSMALVLAAAGLDVMVLERAEEYRDRVRGEFMQPWGALEMVRLGLEPRLVAAGGGWCAQMINYGEDTDPAEAEAAAVPLDALVPGSAGGFCVGHPQASTALSGAAAERGARVLHGVGGVAVTTGRDPIVRYEHAGSAHELACTLVVGADGRRSVVRDSMGVELQTVERDVVLGGLLVHADGWHEDVAALGVEGECHYLAFPRPGGLVRLYLSRLPSEATSGPDRARLMLEGFRLDSLPRSELLATAEPVGPCAYARASDATVDTAAVEGVVLIGDAAGWSDPILGCGLSGAMCDTRSVADVVLGGDDWSPPAFEAYSAERAERMRRLRLSAELTTQLQCTFTPEGRQRRSAFGELMANDLAVQAMRIMPLFGPHNVPAEAFDEEVLARSLAFA
ncbi:MAG: monooxygenase [Acidimicrobiales bacterium]|nr:monooxygenase [Acidimicrobiales bacterium]